MMRDGRLIVGGQRQHQRALAPQFDIDAARPRKLLGETGPTRLAFAAERDECFLARLGLAASRQHAGRGMACPRAGLAAIEHRDIGPRGEPPGDAQPHDARADDDDTRPAA